MSLVSPLGLYDKHNIKSDELVSTSDLVKHHIISDMLEQSIFTVNSQLQSSMIMISLIRKTHFIKVAALREQQLIPSNEKACYGENICRHLGKPSSE